MAAPDSTSRASEDVVFAAAGITKQYGRTLALDNVSISFRRGEIHGLVGHNGAGKSTLLRIIAGAERPDAGELTLHDRVIAPADPNDALAAGIACVYQDLTFPDNLTVTEGLFLGQEVSHRGILDRSRMRREALSLCQSLGLDIDPMARLASASVAERQLLEISAALHRRAQLLLLDEPTTALAPTQIEALFATIRRAARDHGVAVVIVDHRLDEISAVADRVTAMTDGRVTLSGRTSDVASEALVRAIVGTRVRASDGNVGGGGVGAAGTATSHDRPGDGAGVGGENRRPALAVRQLRGVRLGGVDLFVNAGEIVGVYGLTGSGRSRLLRTLFGDEPATAGQIELDGKSFRPRSPGDAIRAGVAYVPEERKANGFIPRMSALRNMTLPVIGRYRRLGFLQRTRMRHDAAEALADLGVLGDVGGPMAFLSGGNQQKVLFGRSALQQPRLLLLDEPTKGIDIGAKAEIHRLIRRLAREHGVAILLVSTEEEEILDVADQVVVMRAGSCDGIRHPAASLGIVALRHLALGPSPSPVAGPSADWPIHPSPTAA
jgi:ABC-type sugar transport system ATPase subunit